jgi:flagellar biosynthetic protein FlhB
MAEDLGDKSEDPTGKRLTDAREKGQVARSQDLAAAVDLVGALILLLVFGASLAKTMTVVLRDTLGDTWGASGNGANVAVSIPAMLDLCRGLAIRLAIAVVPILLLMFAVAVLAHMGQFGFLWNSHALEPKFDKLNPVTGLGRIFSKRSLAKTGVNSGKLMLIAVVFWLYSRSCADTVSALPMLTIFGAWMVIVELIVYLAIWLLVIMFILGAIDFIYQRWQHTQDLKMTKEEVKHERRDMDGDPQIKARRFKIAQELARQRIGTSVPEADVIVTNPTHFSVAIKYDENAMNAPRVVAKGADEVALTIRTIAKAHGIPLVERPPLARALYRTANVGQEVQPQFYEAVAEVLAYVYRLKGKPVETAAA